MTTSARGAFDRQFRDRELPEDIPEAGWPAEEEELPLANLLVALDLAPSTSDARRAILGGGVRLDGEVCKDPVRPVACPAGELLVQRGKRKFVRVSGN